MYYAEGMTVTIDIRPLCLKLSEANRAILAKLADLGLGVEKAPTATEGNPMTSTTSTTSSTDQAAQLRADQNARSHQLKRELRERVAVIDQRILELDQMLTPFSQAAADMLASVRGLVEEVNLKHAAPSPVVARLAHEVISEADKLKLPVDLTVQLLVLAELRDRRHSSGEV